VRWHPGRGFVQHVERQAGRHSPRGDQRRERECLPVQCSFLLGRRRLDDPAESGIQRAFAIWRKLTDGLRRSSRRLSALRFADHHPFRHCGERHIRPKVRVPKSAGARRQHRRSAIAPDVQTGAELTGARFDEMARPLEQQVKPARGRMARWRGRMEIDTEGLDAVGPVGTGLYVDVEHHDAAGFAGR
jgi:hypothetical protein